MLEIATERDALVVVDLQPDFMPGGALAVAGGDEIVGGIAELVPRFRTVVATQDWHPRGHVSFASTHGRAPYETVPLYGEQQILWPDHCIPGTPGAAFHRGFPLEHVSMILRKGSDPRIDSYSTFRENVGPGGTRRPTGLAGFLRERGIQRVILCGLARDFCVLWSAEDAAAAGFGVVVLDQLTRAVFAERRADTDARLTRAGAQVV
ncbi:MAG: nicotinamidase [Polyangiales bacterium]